MAKVFLDPNDSYKVVNDNVAIFGASGDEHIIVESGADNVILDANVENIDFAGNVSDFKFKQQGNQLLVFDSEGNKVAQIGVQEDGTDLAFADGTVQVVLNHDSHKMELGGTEIPSDNPAAVAPENIDTEHTSQASTGGETGGATGEYTITADTTSVEEGNAVTFTVTVSEAPENDLTLNYKINGVSTDAYNAVDPALDFGKVSGQVTIPAGETTATFTVSPTIDNVSEGFEGFKVTLLDNSFNVVANSNNIVVMDGQNVGRVFNLTANSESVTGTDGDDVFIGDDTQLTLDVIDGMGGIDTLRYNDTYTNPENPDDKGGKDINGFGLTLKNVEVIEGRSVGKLSLTTKNFADVTTVKALKSGGDVTIDASSTQDVDVSGSAGDITIDGGKNIAVNDTTADNDIKIGGTTAPTGTITVTDIKQGNGNIAIDGGTDVTVTATSETSSGTIKVGDKTAPTGKISITQNLNSDGTAALNGGDITANGGTSINITVNASSIAKNETADKSIAIGTITATAGDNTTDVTIIQNKNIQRFTKDAVAGTTETATVKFGALKAGDSLTVDLDGDGLADGGEFTFKASKDLTAQEVAAAFANLTDGDTQSEGGITANGFYTGVLNGWTSAAADGDTVVFTSTTPGRDVANLAFVLTNASGNSVAPTVTETDGTDGTAAKTSANDITYGDVKIDDNATASIKTITLDGYDDVLLGDSDDDNDQADNTSLNALETLSLANSSGDVKLDTNRTALTLNVDNVNDVVNLDGAAASSITNLTINASGGDSDFALIDQALENLTINANAALDLSHSIHDNVGNNSIKQVTITGNSKVNLGDVLLDDVGLNSFNASANTGGVTAEITTDKAVLTGDITEYKFSAGDDKVTLDNANVDVKITTGAGNDTVELEEGTHILNKTIDAGEGTDTLVMNAADLDAVTADVTFQDSISGFERVSVDEVAATDSNDGSGKVEYTVNLANLDNISYVYVNGIEADGTDNAGDHDPDGDTATLNINNLANNGTVNLTDEIISAVFENGTDEAKLNINIKDADTNTSDVLNLAMTADNDIENTGSVVANNIENINITATDVFVDEDGDGVDDHDATHTLILNADSATTINITGNAGLVLRLTDDKATLINASSMTGALNAEANNDSETIKGGSGDDFLIAHGSQDVLLGAAGDDVFIAGDLATLTGGDGNDTFIINVPSSVNAYATITDFSSGDKIDLDPDNNGNIVFNNNKINLADTAVFQDYANAAVKAIEANEAAWFQYDGNTYIVEDLGADSNDSFVNGEDAIIKIDGLVDLAHNASYNQELGLLELA